MGSLAHPGKWRAVLSPSTDQPHLVAALDTVSRELGGVSRVWRFDRMATVCDPGSGRVSASFAGVAKHYGVSVAICPPRRRNRRAVVEKVNHIAAQRWWRTLADDLTVEAAQAGLDRFAAVKGDTRLRATADGPSSVAIVARSKPLQPVPPIAYPLAIEVHADTARRMAGQLRFACIPTPATLEDFDVDAAAGIDRNLTNELATCRYLESATNILLIGPPGTENPPQRRTRTRRSTC